MGGNLTKSPLIAVYFGALIPFIAVLFPYSQSYTEVAGTFVMPFSGYIMLVVYALWFSIIMAVAFAGVKGRGIGAAMPLALAACGLGWFAPMLRQLMLGEPTGAVTTGDTALWLVGGCVSTLLTVVLMMLLFKGEDAPEPRPGAPVPKYRINILGLVIRLLVLPVIFMVAYYLLWYFLFWRNAAVREYFDQPELRNFMGEIIDILIYKGFQVVVTLLVGLAYAVFSIPLLLQLPGKRVMFIALNTALYASSTLLYLVPSPFMTGAVRHAYLGMAAVLLVLYGALSGILLHTAMVKEELPAPAPAPAPAQTRPGARPARPVARPTQATTRK